ncbi:4-oxalomesaconate tautomerase [Actinoalloteichus hoggarensis]|uniref:4-oxalomesaconate tautomerase n=2 Tax=Actinoalloteichus hoggarensis TaxID=1470176 RepID=A0A221W955_9PSEU|nr:4-oxalomesaconate tautomerase [Actinoalloteichus hoggarensis]
MRGGTSKCWVFDESAMPAEPSLDRVLAAAFGSSDPRQIDGVGGATSTTSKAAIVRRSADAEVDIEYLFAQVGIGFDGVEWGSNCGNCATAVGLYALQTGLVDARHPVSVVRMRNRNTGAVLTATVPTPDGIVPELGGQTVPGSAAAGVPVALGFLNPAGTSTGALLPTGDAVDRVDSVDASLIDAGAPAMLVDARQIGATAHESVEEFEAFVPELRRLRRLGALRMGLDTPQDPVRHGVPKVGVVAAPAPYRTSTGVAVAAADHDLAVRMLSMHAPHPAIGLTSAVAVAAGVVTTGTLPATLAGNRPVQTSIRLGTPVGVVPVDIDLDDSGAVRAVTLHRAARRIATAELLVPVRVPVPGSLSS